MEYVRLPIQHHGSKYWVSRIAFKGTVIIIIIIIIIIRVCVSLSRRTVLSFGGTPP